MRYGMWQPQCYRVPKSPSVRITPLSKQAKMIPVVVVYIKETVFIDDRIENIIRKKGGRHPVVRSPNRRR